uniref:hypothetical protein n=1 Tax=Salmonella sp. SAL4435 TaxID=3159890 RepID=UPI0039784214
MTSRRVFAVAVVALSAVVAGAVASIRTPPAGSGDPGVRSNRRVQAADDGSQARSVPAQRVETPPVALRPPVLLVRADDN